MKIISYPPWFYNICHTTGRIIDGAAGLYKGGQDTLKNEDIQKRMEKLRDELNELLASEDCDNIQILQLSQELDKLINSYMKHKI